MSVPEVVTQEFSNNSLSSAFADFLAATTPHDEAARQYLARSLDFAPSAFNFEGTLRIDFQATGELHSDTGTLIVGEGAELRANISVATAIIDGELHGDICAAERVELRSHARVAGNIATPSLSIQTGAVFNGQCHFLSPIAESIQPPTAQSSLADLKASKSPHGPNAEDKPKAMSAVAAL